MLDKNYKKIIEKLVSWIKDRVTEAGCEGTVVGLSGGIDSSVTGALCQKAFPEQNMGLIMPCDSNPEDKEDATLVANQFNIKYKIVNLDESYREILSAMNVRKTENNLVERGNIKPRLRMTVLYYHAGLKNRLVAGTDNRSELKLGYFTKYGDGGIDIAPLGNLVKMEVREIARILGIPEKIINKPPSAGLWEGQTDAGELGISYEKIDRYILTGEADEKTKEVVDRLERKNKHKLQVPAIPGF
ncbi:MAG: NAD+ synthase [Halanaerobiaceae bacterium]